LALYLLGSFALAGDAYLAPLVTQSLLLDIQHSAGRLIAVGDRGHVLVSDDEGGSWRQCKVPTEQMLTAVHFPSSRRGWAVGHDGLILASIDGGDTWVIQRDGLVDQRQYDELRLGSLQREKANMKAALLVAAEAPAREALQERLDEIVLEISELEYDLSHPVHAPPLLDVYFSNDLQGVAVGAFNMLLLTEDGGISWTAAGDRLDNPEGMHLNAVTGDGKGGLWLAAEGGMLFRSRDGGANWDKLDSPYPASWFGLARSPRSGVLLAFGLRGNVFRSTDGGDSWFRVETGVQRSLGGGRFLSEDYAVLVGTVGEILLSEDGGISFRSRPLDKRVGLSSVTAVRDHLVVVGQGGIHRRNSLGSL
jgi:photosystem II stability/assembly factor-like uncharacterized protein